MNHRRWHRIPPQFTFAHRRARLIPTSRLLMIRLRTDLKGKMTMGYQPMPPRRILARPRTRTLTLDPGPDPQTSPLSGPWNRDTRHGPSSLTLDPGPENLQADLRRLDPRPQALRG
eukprot:708652-Rhodomonas_salina.3